MKKTLFILAFLFLLTNFGYSQNISPANRNLLQKLLNFPSPPENRSEIIKKWLERETENLSGKTNIIPADDVPTEELVKFWAGKRIYNVPKPSPATQERLLEAAKKDSSLISPLLPFLPTHKEATEIVEKAYSEENSIISSQSVIGEWLMLNSDYKREELLLKIREIQDKAKDDEDDDSVSYANYLIALTKFDWQTAYPFVNNLWQSSDQRLSTLALTILYERAVKENSTDAENLREQLKFVVFDKKAKEYAREIAIESLMKTDWNGRDEWFISLFSDESLNSDCLASVVEENSDYWIPKVAKLLGNTNKNIHLAAVTCLAQFEKFRSREDSMKALLPYLDDTDDWKYTDSGAAIYSLNFIYLPESIPVLKKIVQKSEGFEKGYAR